jgi:hypothetical protein
MILSVKTSQNGWPVLDQAGTRIFDLGPEHGRLRLAAGPAGFVLAHWALWYAETIEPIKGPILDDWGWATPRPIRGQLTGYSNHCSGTAVDLNAQAHALGRRCTLRTGQIVRIRKRLRQRYGDEIAWGGDYVHRADEMHYELDCSAASAAALAHRLRSTSRGRRLQRSNPGSTGE